MKLPLYQIDAFASRVFAGNPAAVVPLDAWLDDATLQGIATENNLSETAFLVGGQGEYEIRWMTPAAEVDLCGHATLAAGLGRLQRARARSDGGASSARRAGRWASRRRATAWPSTSRPRPPGRRTRTPDPSATPSAVHRPWPSPPATSWPSTSARRTCAPSTPDMGKVAAFDVTGVIATAPGNDCDFVSRFFAPRIRHPRGPGDRLRPLHPRALLGEAPREDRRCTPGRSHPAAASCSASCGATASRSPATR